jgi:hypothetical protein
MIRAKFPVCLETAIGWKPAPAFLSLSHRRLSPDVGGGTADPGLERTLSMSTVTVALNIVHTH